MTALHEALQFPFRDKYWIRRLLIGGFLLPIPLINILPIGYLMRHFKAYLSGYSIDRLPEWDDVPLILSLGFWACLILLGYLVIPALIIALGIFVWGGFWGVFLIIIGIILNLYFLSFLPMGLAMFLLDDRLHSAFQKRRLAASISSIGTNYYYCVLYFFLLIVLAGSSPFVLFYLEIVFCQIFGDVIRPVFKQENQVNSGVQRNNDR